jgi:hypothetical protein
VHAPFKTARISKPHTPWVTSNLLIIFKERDKALRKFKSDRTLNNWNHYKELRNFALASLRREKAAYLKYLQNNKRDIDLWRCFKNLNIQPKTVSDLPLHLQNPESINKHFLSTFSKTSSCNNSINFYNSNTFGNSSFQFHLATHQNVLDAIKSNASGLWR